MNTIPQSTLQCEAALSDVILQAARAALPKNPGQWITLPVEARNNEALLALLVGLLDATEATANSVTDNAIDDCRPLPREFAYDLAKQAEKIASILRTAFDAPDHSSAWGSPADTQGFSLPSMSGAELV